MLVIKLKHLGIDEEIALSDAQVLEYINSLDSKTRLDFAIGIEIEPLDVKDQLQMLAAYPNKLISSELDPAQRSVLRVFLQNKLNEL